jgi:hypothetical protein
MYGTKATPEQVASLLRHGDQEQVKALRQATFEVAAWDHIRDANKDGKVDANEAANPPISRKEFEELNSSCGLKA